ncbi:hypothetical protein [Streptomyces sp. NPDC001410]|uniref:hypothetical protein n=1 Tax=Streptomyces sp. NPDC001410 TaxID=3364574 RepID=UPI0036A06CE5
MNLLQEGGISLSEDIRSHIEVARRVARLGFLGWYFWWMPIFIAWETSALWISGPESKYNYSTDQTLISLLIIAVGVAVLAMMVAEYAWRQRRLAGATAAVAGMQALLRCASAIVQYRDPGSRSSDIPGIQDVTAEIDRFTRRIRRYARSGFTTQDPDVRQALIAHADAVSAEFGERTRGLLIQGPAGLGSIAGSVIDTLDGIREERWCSLLQSRRLLDVNSGRFEGGAKHRQAAIAAIAALVLTAGTAWVLTLAKLPGPAFAPILSLAGAIPFVALNQQSIFSSLSRTFGKGADTEDPST